MLFNNHSKFAGMHAFLGASNYHWINYSPDKLESAYKTSQAARRGTELHEFAREAIRLGIRLPDTTDTINQYVNDAIHFRMVPEQLLFYSPYCFGTADTISFRNQFLRIHDYKSGVVKTSEKQLYVYAALFCLEYEHDPQDIDIELRIYQNNEVRVYEGMTDMVEYIMDKYVAFNTMIEGWKEAERTG